MSMANQITCDLCGEEYAVSMVTNLANGDSLAIGEACMLTFHLTVAAELAGNMPFEALGDYAAQITTLAGAVTATPAATPENTSREAARAQYGDLCPECGVPWDQPSPDCPHETWNLHPLPAQEGPADEHAAVPTDTDHAATVNHAGGSRGTRGPVRGGVRRPR